MKQKLLLLVFVLMHAGLEAQVANDDRVLIQGFYWESSHDYPGDWYEYVESLSDDLSTNGIDMIWLPPPSDAGSDEGYLPRELNNFSNGYGSLAEHQSLLTALNNKGIEAIADIVVNHRVGSSNWVDFTNPTWGTNSITADDEVWSQPDYSHVSLRGNYDTGNPYAAARDVDHTQTFVQNDIKAWLDNLKAIGYDGWRYDFVHGFSPYYIDMYNSHSSASYSVGEYWTSDKQTIQNWIDASGSTAFDFPTYYALKGAIKDNNYSYLAYQGAAAGGIGWDPRNYTTFIENHDTPDYDPSNNILTGNNVGQAYAYLLMHPGVPTIFWSHMYEWGATVKDEISSAIAIRKAAGIHSQSVLNILVAAADKYVAQVTGTNHDVIVKLGSGAWGDPSNEGISGNWSLATYGNNYAIWTSGGTPSNSYDFFVQGYTHAYAWDDNQNALLGAWPGTPLTSDPSGWSSVSIADDCPNIIFSNNGSGQTADLATCESTPYFEDGTWYASAPDNNPGNDYNIYAQGYTHAYAWDDNQNALLGAWPGTALTSGSGGWNFATVSDPCVNVIFSYAGSGQTADLYTCAAAPYYNNGIWSSTGSSTSNDLTIYAQGYTHAYAWDNNQNALLGAWPGTALSSNNGWNSTTISANCANVIFSYNGSGQTADLYTCGPDSYWYNNSWNASNPSARTGTKTIDRTELISPNPFFDQTKVSFHLAEEGMVNLTWFTLTGKEIPIFKGVLPAGEHEITVDESDLNVQSSIYISQLITGHQKHTTKVLWTK